MPRVYLLLVAVRLLLEAVPATSTQKSGICISGKQTRCDDMNAANSPLSANSISWYHNWARYPAFGHDPYKSTNSGQDCAILPEQEFVPMILKRMQKHIDAGYVTATDPPYIQTTNTRYLLGFNEPNRVDGAALYPKDAADFYKEFIIPLWADSLSLVSPVACVGRVEKCIPGYAVAEDWYDDFFGNFSGDTMAERIESSRIDFIAMHSYACNADTTMEKALALYQRYGKPLWVTEFACGTKANLDKKSVAKEIALIDELIPRLESAEYVFRYSWFASRRDNDIRSVLVYEDWDVSSVAPRLTDVGTEYMAATAESNVAQQAVSDLVLPSPAMDLLGVGAVLGGVGAASMLLVLVLAWRAWHWMASLRNAGVQKFLPVSAGEQDEENAVIE